MSGDVIELLLRGEEQTLRLGLALGRVLAPGAVALLRGGLGAGKTTLARGLARGLGVGDDYNVVSPTFTLLNVYPGPTPFFHADLYRLDLGGALDLGLLEESAEGVLAVEWAEVMDGCWPETAVDVWLTGEAGHERRARISGPAAVLGGLRGLLNIQAD